MTVDTELLIRTLCFAFVFLAMALWESLAPRRAATISRWQRWPSNLGIAALNTLLLRVAAPTATVGAALLAESHGFGLLSYLEVQELAQILIGLLVLDLAIYLQHVLFHAVPALWRLHRVHHSDLQFDVTTGLRFHPFEILISFAFKIGIVLAMGISPLAVLLFEILLNGTSMFNHGNVRMPYAVDRWLRMVVVTPDMHRVHHSLAPAETNTNFGFNLSWWDRLLGTYRAQPETAHETMMIGVEAFRSVEEEKILRMLTQPFRGSAGSYPISRNAGV